jgi:hypothetical protein
MTSNNLTEELLTSETSNGDMSKANTFLDMNDLCDDSLEALIQHYLKLKHRMPDNLSVRERLVELQDERFNREREASTIEGVIRQNTNNPIQNQ